MRAVGGREAGLSLSPDHREPSSSDPTCHQVPLPEEIQVSPGDTEIHRVEPEDVANHLTAFHWELFRCVHEVRWKPAPGGGWGSGGGDGRLLLRQMVLARRLACGTPWAVNSHNLHRSLSLHREKWWRASSAECCSGPSAAYVGSESGFSCQDS